MDVLPVGAGKGAAMEYVRARMGFCRGHTVAAGDSANDLLMLQQVGGRWQPCSKQTSAVPCMVGAGQLPGQRVATPWWVERRARGCTRASVVCTRRARPCARLPSTCGPTVPRCVRALLMRRGAEALAPELPQGLSCRAVTLAPVPVAPQTQLAICVGNSQPEVKDWARTVTASTAAAVATAAAAASGSGSAGTTADAVAGAAGGAPGAAAAGLADGACGMWGRGGTGGDSSKCCDGRGGSGDRGAAVQQVHLASEAAEAAAGVLEGLQALGFI